VEGALTSGGGVEPQPSGGELRPLSVSETIETALRLYRDNAITLWKIVALIIVPIEIIEVILRRVSLPAGVFVHSGGLYINVSGQSNNQGATVALLLVVVLGLLAQLLATGAVFKLQLDAYLGRPHDLEESFEFAAPRVFSLLWLGIISTVLATIGFILFVIPGIWFVVAVSVAVPALMLEGVTGFSALRRSFNLTAGRWWATFGRLLVALVLYAIADVIIGLIANGLDSAFKVSNVTLYLIINGVIGAIIVILLAPFAAAVFNVIYIDLRVRKEGLTKQQLAAGFGPPSHPIQSTGGPTGLGGPGNDPSWPPR
jgi:hypothetical protein